MIDAFEITYGGSWNKKIMNLADKSVEVAIKRFETHDSAVELFTKHYLQIASCGGAIIIGDSTPASMITAQEMAYYAKFGLEILKQEEFWIQVMVFRSVTFEQMLAYIASAGTEKAVSTTPHS